MNFEHYEEAVRRSCAYVSALQAPDGSHAGQTDMCAYYKAPWLFSAVGDYRGTARYLNFIRNAFLQENGDFRSSREHKAYIQFPSSAAHRYTYINGWMVGIFHRMGHYDVSRRGLSYVLKFQSPEHGGFYSSADPRGEPVPDRADTSSTASNGFALLWCGDFPRAIRAADFILQVIDAQPEPKSHFYNYCLTGKGLMTSLPEGQLATNFLVRTDQPKQYYWLLGKAAKFLTRAFVATNEEKYLEGAKFLIDFFDRCQEDRMHHYGSGKVMWTAASLYRLTGEGRFKDLALALADFLASSQHPDGTYFYDAMFNSPAEQPMSTNLDLTMEMAFLLTEVMQDLEVCG